MMELKELMEKVLDMAREKFVACYHMDRMGLSYLYDFIADELLKETPFPPSFRIPILDILRKSIENRLPEEEVYRHKCINMGCVPVIFYTGIIIVEEIKEKE